MNKIIITIKEIEVKLECKEMKIIDKPLVQVDLQNEISSFNFNKTCKILEKQRCKNKWQ